MTPVHFYEPVPDTRSFGDELWSRRSSLVGIDLNEAAQLALLDRFAHQYRAEYQGFPFDKATFENGFFFGNGQYETVDAEILYCMVRDLRPRRIIEIGSGFSTRVIHAAIRQNARMVDGYHCDLTCVEPYPSDELRRSLDGVGQLIDAKVEDLSFDIFARLGRRSVRNRRQALHSGIQRFKGYRGSVNIVMFAPGFAPYAASENICNRLQSSDGQGLCGDRFRSCAGMCPYLPGCDA